MKEFCGHHVYKEVWKAVIGKVLVCKREAENASDRDAVAVKKEGTIIGHSPQKLSQVCSLFLRCRKYFVRLIFVALCNYEHFSMEKIYGS